MKKNKKIYEAPLLTVVEFRTEKGFAASDDNYIVNSQQAIQAFIDKEIHSQVMGMTTENGVVAATMEGNEDHTNAGGGTSWQYSNGGWF